MNGAVRPATSKAKEPSLAVAVVRLLPAGEESLRVTVPATGPPVAAVPVSATVTAVAVEVPVEATLLLLLPPLHAATASDRAIANEARKTNQLRHSGRPMAIPPIFSTRSVRGRTAPCGRYERCSARNAAPTDSIDPRNNPTLEKDESV
jgi:hypothetical protein